MVWVAGADGCRRGWFRASRETRTGELRFDVHEKPSGLLRTAPSPRVLGIDIPIGLPDQGRRACDEAARGVLGPRRSSVFAAPIRAALRAASREEASRITFARDGRRVSTQAWGIYPKVRSVDALLTVSPEARARIREVHPEVCFWAWNAGQPMPASKKTRAGRLRRRRHVEGWLGAGVVAAARRLYARRDVADDDILDALAALWTATRIVAGQARTLPAVPPVDSTGLRMEIVY